VLIHSGYAVDTAEDGAAAWERFIPIVPSGSIPLRKQHLLVQFMLQMARMSGYGKKPN
jgi:hypothetical protein